MKNRVLFVFLIISVLFITSCNQKFKPAEYANTTGLASPGNETRIELEDGAAISIPSNSIEKNVNVKIERNPEKANGLPALPDNVIQVSDFYNFDIGDAQLSGPVDLVLPFDLNAVPEGKGIFTVAYPSENGWKYVPVIPNGNKITLYTNDIGDPIIAWHFMCGKNIDLKYETFEDPCEEERAKRATCDPNIPLSAIQDGDQVLIVGHLMPSRNGFFGDVQKENAANIPVQIFYGVQNTGARRLLLPKQTKLGDFR
jgi:hypothetical protein